MIPFRVLPFFGPSDLLTSTSAGIRRIKGSAEPSLVAGVENGFVYAITAEVAVPASEDLAINLSPAAKSLVHRVVINRDEDVLVYDAHATGTADGIFNAVNLNKLSIDTSPSTAQAYTDATAQGTVLAAGTKVVEPYVICGFETGVAVLTHNSTITSQTFRVTLLLEELGAREESFGLTASTLLVADTEMGVYG